MLSHHHPHLMFYPNCTGGLNNGFLYLWPVLLRVIIGSKDDQDDQDDRLYLWPVLLVVMIGTKDDQSGRCDQDGVIVDKKMEKIKMIYNQDILDLQDDQYVVKSSLV